MFENSETLLFLGVETFNKRNNDGVYSKIIFANPITYDKFSLFLPDNIKPFDQGLRQGEKVIVKVSIKQEGYNLRTDLISVVALDKKAV